MDVLKTTSPSDGPGAPEPVAIEAAAVLQEEIRRVTLVHTSPGLGGIGLGRRNLESKGIESSERARTFHPSPHGPTFPENPEHESHRCS